MGDRLSEFERAAIKACDGLPAAWLDRGFVKEMYTTMAFLLLADKVGERRGREIVFPENWWRAHARDQLDKLNEIALSDQSYRSSFPGADPSEHLASDENVIPEARQSGDADG